MKRSELKELIKECLVEILQEGIGPIAGVPAQRSRPLVSDSSRAGKPSIRSALTSESRRPVPQRPRPKYDPRLDERVDHAKTANVLTSDPVMASIFADTAATTMLEQDGLEEVSYQPAGGDVAGMAMARHAPEEVFENADRWSRLAFAKPAKKTSDAPIHASASSLPDNFGEDPSDDPFAGIR